ncbi:MAG TPA: hypothetical protein VFA15_00695 [Nitrososphaera sp.]|nr:hypothetical protein [Nitrososphaera sp.]
MYHPEYGKALDLVKKLHNDKYRPKINTKNQDVRLALYYLTGGSITEAILSLKAWANGDLNTPMRAKRYIDEIKMLILCLMAVQNRERYVRRFFQDEIVTIKPKQHEKEILKAMGMDKTTFDEWMRATDTLSHGFSKGIHPTLNSVAYNSAIDTGEFDYDAKRLAFSEIQGFDFGNFIIIPTIDAVSIPSEVFGVSNTSSEIKEIKHIRENIQNIAIRGHLARRGIRKGI